jgi:uncharacterized DUF497 family protein
MLEIIFDPLKDAWNIDLRGLSFEHAKAKPGND